MPEFIETSSVMSQDAILDSIIEDELVEYNDSVAKILGSYAFYYKTKLRKLYLPNLQLISNWALYESRGLEKVVIGTNYSSIVTVPNSSAIETGSRTIFYVKDDKIANYKNATVWKDLPDRIFPLSSYDNIVWDETEITDDHETIISNINNKLAPSKYHVGQYTTIDLGDEGQIRFQIAGFRMRKLADSDDVAEVEWVAMDLLNTPRRIQESGTFNWETSELRTYLNDSVYNLFPDKWKNVIKLTTSVTTSRNKAAMSKTTVSTDDLIRIPSIREMAFAATSYSFCEPDDSTGYGVMFFNNNSRKRTRHYWLRSAASNNAAYGLYVNANSGVTAAIQESTNQFLLLSFST